MRCSTHKCLQSAVYLATTRRRYVRLRSSYLKLWSRALLQGVSLNPHQLVALASDHGLHPQVFDAETIQKLFHQCFLNASNGDGSTNPNASLDCLGFCEWLAHAATELGSQGGLDQICPSADSRLELLLVRMDRSIWPLTVRFSLMG